MAVQKDGKLHLVLRDKNGKVKLDLVKKDQKPQGPKKKGAKYV